MDLLLLLAISGQLMKDAPEQGEKMSIENCTHSCYFDINCAGIFYSREDRVCYRAYMLYSFAMYEDDHLEDKEEFMYYEWRNDDCNGDEWNYHHPTHTCFKYMAKDVSFYDASAKCRAMNSSLLSLNGIERIRYFRQLAKHIDKDIWTSGYRNGSSWKWENGDPIRYNDWKSGQPDDSPDDCLFIIKEGDGWESKKCTDDGKHYICERRVDAICT